MKRMILGFVLSFFVAVPAFAFEKQCYTLDAKAGILPLVIENIQMSLKQGGLPDGFPQFGRIEIEGDARVSHTLKASPVTTADEADAVRVSEKDFVTLNIWGLTPRAFDFDDFIYLLQEEDRNLIDNGFKGIERKKFIQVGYIYVYRNEPGITAEEMAKAQLIIDAARKGILEAGASKVDCLR